MSEQAPPADKAKEKPDRIPMPEDKKELSSTRLDKVLTRKLEKYSRMQIKMLIKNGNVKLNNQTIFDPSYLVRENDKFEVSIVQSNEIKYTGEDIKLEILYEDKDLLVINKQEIGRASCRERV